MDEGISFEEYLDAHGSLTYANVGVSMQPLLHEGRDLFTVVPKVGRLKVGDVALYRRPPAQWVLHRVVKVVPLGYLTIGDNSVCREYVPEDAAIARMTGFVRDGRSHEVTEPTYRLYTGIVLLCERPRVMARRVLSALGRRLRAFDHA